MRIVPFVYCVVMTSILLALYISRHNTLTELRIEAVGLERRIRSEEAQVGRLEVEFAQFLSPIRLEEIAKKAQYAHLQQPIESPIIAYDLISQ